MKRLVKSVKTKVQVYQYRTYILVTLPGVRDRVAQPQVMSLTFKTFNMPYAVPVTMLGPCASGQFRDHSRSSEVGLCPVAHGAMGDQRPHACIDALPASDPITPKSLIPTLSDERLERKSSGEQSHAVGGKRLASGACRKGSHSPCDGAVDRTSRIRRGDIHVIVKATHAKLRAGAACGAASDGEYTVRGCPSACPHARRRACSAVSRRWGREACSVACVHAVVRT